MRAAVRAIDLARAGGARVSVDLSSVEHHPRRRGRPVQGIDRVARARRRLRQRGGGRDLRRPPSGRDLDPEARRARVLVRRGRARGPRGGRRSSTRPAQATRSPPAGSSAGPTSRSRRRPAASSGSARCPGRRPVRERCPEIVRQTQVPAGAGPAGYARSIDTASRHTSGAKTAQSRHTVLDRLASGTWGPGGYGTHERRRRTARRAGPGMRPSARRSGSSASGDQRSTRTWRPASWSSTSWTSASTMIRASSSQCVVGLPAEHRLALVGSPSRQSTSVGR